ncbi:MAG: pyruvate, water dikinase regulatory protein [Bacteroidales bacterium]
MYYVMVVSDGTGRTGQQALQAALTQFPSVNLEVLVRSEVLSAAEIKNVVEEASRLGAVIVHTIVSNEHRALLLEIARKLNVEQIDLMGPFLLRLSNLFANAPSEKPGLFNELNRDYFRRIEAMEFTFRHDDGQKIHEIDKADIVLIGVSRTFKTPLSIYLAIKGWLVANVPLVLGIPPDPVLERIDPTKVFCLTTYPTRLAQLRRSRYNHLGGLPGDYANHDYVSRELRYAHRIFHAHPKWAVINVTSRAIEEIASEILSIYSRSHSTD